MWRALVIASIFGGLACASTVGPGSTSLPAAAQSDDAAPGAEAAVAEGRWTDALRNCAEVLGDPAAPPADRAAAQLLAARAMAGMELRTAAVAMYAAIGATADHPRHEEALRRMLELADSVSPGVLRDAVAGFPESVQDRVVAELPPERALAVHLGSARHAYDAGKFEPALAILAVFDGAEANPQTRPLQQRALILRALVHVQLRKSVPAVQALEQAVALGETNTDAESTRLSGLASLLIARTYYSAALRVDPPRHRIQVDRAKMLAAIDHYTRVDKRVEVARPVAAERAWAFASGIDLDRARADVATALGTSGYDPEMEVLGADLAWRAGEKSKARSGLQQVLTAFDPVHEALAGRATSFDAHPEPDTVWSAFVRQAIEHPDAIDQPVRAPVTRALWDPEIRSEVAALARVDAEQSRLAGMAVAFRDTGGGALALDAVASAHKAARRRVAAAGRARIAHEVETLRSALDDARAGLTRL